MSVPYSHAPKTLSSSPTFPTHRSASYDTKRWHAFRLSRPARLRSGADSLLFACSLIGVGAGGRDEAASIALGVELGIKSLAPMAWA